MHIGDHFEDSQEDGALEASLPAGESADSVATPNLNSGHESATRAAEAISLENRANFVKHCEENTARLTGAAYRVTGNHCDAQDTVQNVWMKFWEAWSDADFRDRVLNNRGYSYSAVVRAAIDVIRSEKSRSEREEKEARKVVVKGGDYLCVEDDDSFRGMLDVLQSLNPTWRLVIHLRYSREFKIAEVAALLRISEATARRYEKRALKALEEAYKGN
ncbi:RNA polymerase sigma factor [Streptomyces sp. NPDC050164]|uniref:RNA polymerase sigma factor n=1 Tax=Streptomyces sp. NPDC050164 TaxID=3365605 RepID=UPI003794AB95